MATPVTKGVVYARPRDRDRPGTRIDLVAASSVRRLVGHDVRVRVETQAPDELAGPLKRGAREGTLIVRAGDRVIARVPLLTGSAVAAVPLLTRVARTIATPGSLVAIAVLLGGAAVLLTRRRWRADSRRADMEAAA